MNLGWKALLIFAGMMAMSNDISADEVQPVWTDAQKLTVEGRGWSDTPGPYHRLPTKAVGGVREPVRDLATNSAGLLVRFNTDSSEIWVKWDLLYPGLDMPHMPSTGMSGVDLYVKTKDGLRWLANGRPAAQKNSLSLISRLPKEMREYALYLPLYNGVSSVEVGIEPGSTLKAEPVRKDKPIVFYGTSITQGGCASRPGMAYPAIIGRKLDLPTINLGFSGNGQAEPEVADLLAELDPAVFVIDCLPNLLPQMVAERMPNLIATIHKARPDTPVVLVENITYQNERLYNNTPTRYGAKNVHLEKLYKSERSKWAGKLYYVKGDKLLGSDGEATVDGTHPTDVGFLRIADALLPTIRKALGR